MTRFALVTPSIAADLLPYIAGVMRKFSPFGKGERPSHTILNSPAARSPTT